MTTPTKFFKPKVDKYIQLYSKNAKTEIPDWSGIIQTITLEQPGRQYEITDGDSVPDWPPSILISAPDIAGGVQATASLVVDSSTSSVDGNATPNNDGKITSIALTNAGSGYTKPPTITLSGVKTYNMGLNILSPVEYGATAYIYAVDENDVIQDFPIGSGYTSDPTITLSAPDIIDGNEIQATCDVFRHNNKIHKINMVAVGRGYSSPPTVSITGGGGTLGNITLKATPYRGFGAVISSVITPTPSTAMVKKFTWDLETPIEVNENALLEVVDRCYFNILPTRTSYPIIMKMYEIGTKSISNCKNNSKQNEIYFQNDDFYQGRIVDIGLPNRTIKNDIKLEINPQIIDRIVLDLNHGISNQDGVSSVMEFVVIIKVSEQEPQQIEYGSLNNLNINQFGI